MQSEKPRKAIMDAAATYPANEDPVQEIRPLIGSPILSVEELFSRMRAREPLTQGAFRGKLRRAAKAGWLRRIDAPGSPRYLITDAGLAALQEEVLDA